MYRLGQIGTGTFAHDLKRWIARWRGRADPSAICDSHDGETPRAQWNRVLDSINLDLYPGEVFGLIGPNGAGKSTLLKLLSRITRPTGGEIRLRGRVASLLEVGTGFHPELTGRENTYLNGSILGMSRAEIRRQLDQIIEFAECRRYIDTPVKRYSSGMLVRLGFSVAAHLTCDVLIVDEVLAVGDADFQKRCIGKVRDVAADEKRTVIFVSHNLSTVAQLCTRCGVLRQGRLQFVGNAQEAIDHYAGATQSDSSTPWDQLPQYGPRRYGRLTGVSVRDSSGRRATVFRMGEPMRVVLNYRCSQPFPSAEIGFKISTPHGTPIHYCPTSWENEPSGLDRGDYQFTGQLHDLRLLPGHYSIGAWALRQGGKSDHAVPMIQTFEVIQSPAQKVVADFSRYCTGVGETYAPCTWSMSPLADGHVD